MPNYLVLRIGTYTKADLVGGQWLPVNARQVNGVADAAAAITAAAPSFGVAGAGGRFAAVQMSNVEVGSVPEQRVLGATVIEP